MKLKYNYEDELTKFISSRDALYHFTRKETALEYILTNNKLRMGDFTVTSDPQEYRPKLTSAAGWGWDDNHFDKISTITRKIDQLVKSSGFISLCQNQYDEGNLIQEGCLKSRMWSQYGGNHSGICLAFSKEFLLQEIHHKLGSDHKILSNAVVYKDPSSRRTSSSLMVNGDELEKTPSYTIAKNYILESQDLVFFQKQPDYKDENEFRIVAVAEPENAACGKFIDITNSLKIIILGDAFPKVYLPSIKILSDKLNVPYRKLHWEKAEYLLFRWEN